jgi:outer membrane protein TolC
MRQAAITSVIIAALAAGCESGGVTSDIARRQAIASQPAAARPASLSGDVPVQPSLPQLGESSELADYLAYAALNNPGLEAAFNQWKASLERIPQVKALPDPQFTYAYFLRRDMVDPQRQGFAVMQMFPWFGKLALRGDAAAEAARAAQKRFEAARVALFFEVKDAWYEYYYLARSTAITRDNVALLQHVEGVARSRYRAAAASHPDVIRAQVELGKLEDRYRAMLDLRGPAAARLNAALNRPVDMDIPFPTGIAQPAVRVVDQELLATLLEASPELGAMDFEITAAQREIDLAKKEYYPDLTVGLEFMDMADEPVDSDPLMASLSLNIPLWRGKYAAGVREARLRHLAARQQRTETANSLSSQLKMALYQFRDAERKINLYGQTLLPKAEESLTVTENGYRAQTATFTDLVDAQRILLEFQLEHERALANRAQSLAKLEVLVGREIHPVGNPRADRSVKVSRDEASEGVIEVSEQ